MVSNNKNQPAFFGYYLSVVHVILFSRQVRIRSDILQQLKDLKALSEEGILSESEFAFQKQNLLQELKDL